MEILTKAQGIALREKYERYGHIDGRQRLLSQLGWHDWSNSPPKKGVLVKVMRADWMKPDVISTSGIDPMTNVVDLYWLPIDGGLKRETR